MEEFYKMDSKTLRKHYPEGTILFDVRYNRSPECFEVVYYNPITQRLEVNYEEAFVDLWFLKPECRTNQYQISQAHIADCYSITCKPSHIPRVIAQEIGGEWAKLYESMKDAYGMFDIKKKMCECPWVFKGDFTEDVYFRLRWIQTFGDEADISKVTTAFLDIETDVVDRSLDMDDFEHAPQPINAVSLILPEQKICVLCVLGPRPRHLLAEKYHSLLDKQEKAYEWLINHQEEFKRKCIEFDEDNRKYLDGFEMRLHIFDYDKEIYMIKTIFEYINKYRPWFTLSWNAPFDDNYLKNRIEYLGYDPKSFFIPKEFKTKTLYFKKDQDPKATIKSSKDFFYASSYTQYLCQERNFAAIRKSQQEQRSYKLDYIGGTQANIHKKKSATKIKFREFAYLDFINFLLYNVRDTVVQYAIETNTGDAGSLYARSYTFATQFSKCFQETHIVRNRREFFFEKDGYVQACRLLIPEGYDHAFEGAYVAEPHLNYETGLIINGKRHNNIIYGALDADAKSYYPSNKMGLNLDPMTLLYKCIINNDLFRASKCINRSFNQEYIWYDSKKRPHEKDLTGPIVNAYKNDNIDYIMHNWMNAPDITSCFQELDTQLAVC
jgi:hypothetical protein